VQKNATLCTSFGAHEQIIAYVYLYLMLFYHGSNAILVYKKYSRYMAVAITGPITATLPEKLPTIAAE